MRVEPELDEVVNGDRGMLRAIDVCLQQQCLVAAVSLIFASIDALAALTRPDPSKRTTRSVFISWVDKYLKPEENLGCHAVDLYAARSSVLHIYSTDSELVREGKARPIVYEWQAGPRADTTVLLPPEALIIHVEALDTTFRAGVRAFIIDSEMDLVTKGRVLPNLKTMLCYRPWPQLIVYEAA